VSDKGVTRRNNEIIAFAKEVAERLRIVGPANIQCKWEAGNVSLIEVNPRFSGGIPLTIASGADFTSWLVQLAAEVQGRPCHDELRREYLRPRKRAQGPADGEAPHAGQNPRRIRELEEK
jgi:carbamoylphosphate synthase large subunit